MRRGNRFRCFEVVLDCEPLLGEVELAMRLEG